MAYPMLARDFYCLIALNKGTLFAHLRYVRRQGQHQKAAHMSSTAEMAMACPRAH